MKLWQRAAGALKDQNSIWAASFSRKSSYRNPNLEAAIIKATSHDELHVDYRNAQRVFAWIRTTPSSLKPLVWALSKRMEKTKSWIVALKGLILMHGVFCCKVPAVQKIGRLPFDLSGFQDGHTRPSISWGFNNFIRSYYAFLDHRSAFLYEQQSRRNDAPMVQEIFKLQKWQSLLDLLLQIKPQSKTMRVALILEAMDCLIIEIYDVYSRICSGVARVLLGIYSAEKPEVVMALKALQKATEQGEELSSYFEFCREFGVLNMMEIPKVIQIPEEDIEDLKRIIDGFNPEDKEEDAETKYEDTESKEFFDNFADEEKENALAVSDQEQEKLKNNNNNNKALTTIITDKWEVFDEGNEGNHHQNFETRNNNNPFLDSANILPLVPVPVPVPVYKNDLPDLILF